MKILHIVKTPRGAVWAAEQMGVLVRKGLDIHVLCPADSSFSEHCQRLGVAVHALPVSGLNKKISAVRETVDRVQPDLIQSHFCQTTMYMRLALGRNGPPRAFQVPGPLHLEYWLYRQLDVKSGSRPDYWISTCKWMRDCYVNAGVSEDRVFLSYYGTSLPKFDDPPTGILRRELGLADDCEMIGMVAYAYAPKKMLLKRSRGIKGHEDFIEAIRILRGDGRNVVGVVVGGPWFHGEAYFEKLKRLAEQKCGDKIVFLGTRMDLHTFYKEFRVVAHPSLSENLGGASESLLHGVPTVSTDVGGFPDIVLDGKTGITVPPKNPEALSRAIAHYLDHPEIAFEHAKAGQDLCRELIDLEKTASSLIPIYQQIQNHYLANG